LGPLLEPSAFLIVNLLHFSVAGDLLQRTLFLSFHFYDDVIFQTENLDNGLVRETKNLDNGLVRETKNLDNGLVGETKNLDNGLVGETYYGALCFIEPFDL